MSYDLDLWTLFKSAITIGLKGSIYHVYDQETIVSILCIDLDFSLPFDPEIIRKHPSLMGSLCMTINSQEV